MRRFLFIVILATIVVGILFTKEVTYVKYKKYNHQIILQAVKVFCVFFYFAAHLKNL